MNPDFQPYYQYKYLINHQGYQIIVNENTLHRGLKRFVISVFNNKKLIGQSETDTKENELIKIKKLIDRAVENGARLVYLNVSD